jgi:biopolymer transport protein ExbD
MHWARLALTCGTVFVLALSGCGESGLDSEKGSEAPGTSGSTTPMGTNLPVAGSAKALDGAPDLLEVRVLESGVISVLGKEYDSDRLKEMLFESADKKRDLDHPAQPSELGVVIRADPRAPWKSVLEVFRSCGDPAVRIYRIHCAVRTGESGPEGLVETFLAKDRGLAKTRMKLAQPAKITVRMGDALPGGRTSVKVLDVPFTLDGAGKLGVRKLIDEIHSRDDSLPGEIIASDGVPWEDVVWMYDTLVSAGVTMFGSYLLPSHDSPQLAAFSAALRASNAAQAEEAVREKMGSGAPNLTGALFDDKTGLTDAAYAYLTGKVGAAAALTLLEPILVNKPENRERVRALLETQEHTRSELEELVTKIEPSWPLLVAAARLSAAGGGQQDDLRALTLLHLASCDPEDRYGERWWNTQVLVLRLYDQFYRDFKVEQARVNLVNLVKNWRDLGVLERSPVKDEILKLESASNR